MTDRTITLVVTLDKEYRIDDVEHPADAIKMIKGVLDVHIIPFESQDRLNQFTLKQQMRKEIMSKIIDIFDKC